MSKRTLKATNYRIVGTIGCKKCHTTKSTLIKGPDSYYCKKCLAKINKKENK